MRRTRKPHEPLDIAYYQRALNERGYLDPLWMRQWLIDRVAEAGGQQALSRQLKVAQRAVSDCITGKSRMSHALARELGFRRTDRPGLYYRGDYTEARAATVARLIDAPIERLVDGNSIVLTPDQMRALIAAAVRELGSQHELARRTKVPQRRISDAVLGLRPTSAGLAMVFGFYRMAWVSVEYRPTHWSVGASSPAA
jgi:hypothetical protein